MKENADHIREVGLADRCCPTASRFWFWKAARNVGQPFLYSKGPQRALFCRMNWQKDVSLLVLRLGAGGLMVPHGWGKLNQLIKGLKAGEVQFYDWMGIGAEASLALAVVGELVAPLFIVLGLCTRWMSIPAAVTMAVAAFIVHAGDPLGDKEHALLFFFPFLVTALMGGGRYSLDHVFTRPK